ncbi:MAG: zinc-binding dehydrogenase [Deltaproteobacteria bacterium]|nr:zinc-binding dehydrogenase [Deltaproteobacteria bacterium]
MLRAGVALPSRHHRPQPVPPGKWKRALCGLGPITPNVTSSTGEGLPPQWRFGATDAVTERGDEAAERVRELTKGLGVQSVLECVGTKQAIETAMSMVRPGGAVGRVGVPHYDAVPDAQPMFYHNVSVAGGPAPVRAYVAELLPDVMEGRIEPGRVFDRTVDLDGVPDGYRAMNEREALKVMIRP